MEVSSIYDNPLAKVSFNSVWVIEYVILPWKMAEYSLLLLN